MNARVTLSNGTTVKENGDRTIVFQAKHDKFEVVFKILKCA
jgi:hypothetical protein